MNGSGKEQAERSFIRRQRLAFGMLAVFTPFLVYFCVKLVKFSVEIPWPGMRIPMLALMGLVIFLYLLIIGLLLRRRLRTGHFFLTRSEILAEHEQVWNKMGAGKPLKPQAKYYVPLVILLAVFPVMAIMPLTLLRGPLGPIPRFLQISIVAFIAAILSLPGWFLFKTIRRKLSSGSFLPSQEEIAKTRARSRKPQPLWSRILWACMMWTLAGMFTSNLIIDHLRLSSPNTLHCVLAASFWIFAIFWLWQVFHPIKPVGALLEEEQEPQKKDMKTSYLAALVVLFLALASIFPIYMIRSFHPYRAIYPAAAQARADLAAALQSAAQNHRHILLDFGASWCPDCQTIDRYYRDPTNQPIVQANFILVRVNTDSGNTRNCRNANEDLAKQYGVPLDKGIPALAVLSDKGELIYSQRNGEFEDMRHLKSSDLTTFLLRWKP